MKLRSRVGNSENYLLVSSRNAARSSACFWRMRIRRNILPISVDKILNRWTILLRESEMYTDRRWITDNDDTRFYRQFVSAACDWVYDLFTVEERSRIQIVGATARRSVARSETARRGQAGEGEGQCRPRHFAHYLRRERDLFAWNRRNPLKSPGSAE